MASKICFVNLDSINVTPYFSYYEEIISGNYDIVFWDRGKADKLTNAQQTFTYKHKVDNKTTIGWLLQLLTGYIGFRKFASRILKANTYETIVLLTGNVAVLLSNTLIKKYSGQYIVDIRDYFLENNPIYKIVEDSVLEHSALNIISSPAYHHFLGNHDFQIMHNVHPISEEEKALVLEKSRPSNPMVLATIGTAKNISYDKKIINYFANDNRFFLKFIGRGYDQLLPYCQNRKINNVYIKGDFKSSETINYYKDVDVIMSMYGSSKTHFKYQLTNKLYYAVQLGIPLIVCPKTFMEKIVKQYSLGLALNLNDPHCKEQILKLYSKQNRTQQYLGSKRFSKAIQIDNSLALKKLESILNKNNDE